MVALGAGAGRDVASPRNWRYAKSLSGRSSKNPLRLVLICAKVAEVCLGTKFSVEVERVSVAVHFIADIGGGVAG